jgi:archaellum component FlaC
MKKTLKSIFISIFLIANYSLSMNENSNNKKYEKKYFYQKLGSSIKNSITTLSNTYNTGKKLINYPTRNPFLTSLGTATVFTGGLLAKKQVNDFINRIPSKYTYGSAFMGIFYISYQLLSGLSGHNITQQQLQECRRENNDNFNKINDNIDELKNKTDDNFTKINDNIRDNNKLLQTIEPKINTIETKITGMENDLLIIKDDLTTIKNRLKKLSTIEKLITNMKSSMDTMNMSIETKHDRTLKSIKNIENSMINNTDLEVAISKKTAELKKIIEKQRSELNQADKNIEQAFLTELSSKIQEIIIQVLTEKNKQTEHSKELEIKKYQKW